MQETGTDGGFQGEELAGEPRGGLWQPWCEMTPKGDITWSLKHAEEQPVDGWRAVFWGRGRPKEPEVFQGR